MPRAATSVAKRAPMVAGALANEHNQTRISRSQSELPKRPKRSAVVRCHLLIPSKQPEPPLTASLGHSGSPGAPREAEGPATAAVVRQAPVQRQEPGPRPEWNGVVKWLHCASLGHLCVCSFHERMDRLCLHSRCYTRKFREHVQQFQQKTSPSAQPPNVTVGPTWKKLPS